MYNSVYLADKFYIQLNNQPKKEYNIITILILQEQNLYVSIYTIIQVRIWHFFIQKSRESRQREPTDNGL